MRAIDPTTAANVVPPGDLSDTIAGGVEVPMVAGNTKNPVQQPEPTVVARKEDLRRDRHRSALEWDTSPTENLSGSDMDEMADGDRRTAFAVPAPTVAVALPAPRAPLATVHDPAIQTTQAVRVVVWRDATGVHVAPAGTVVSAISIDAVLVVLEEGADLTAWLSQRER
jgi:hypothetical protein